MRRSAIRRRTRRRQSAMRSRCTGLTRQSMESSSSTGKASSGCPVMTTRQIPQSGSRNASMPPASGMSTSSRTRSGRNSPIFNPACMALSASSMDSNWPADSSCARTFRRSDSSPAAISTRKPPASFPAMCKVRCGPSLLRSNASRPSVAINRCAEATSRAMRQNTGPRGVRESLANVPIRFRAASLAENSMRGKELRIRNFPFRLRDRFATADSAPTARC